MLQLNIVVVLDVLVVVLDFILAAISSSELMLISLSRVTHTQIGTTK